jgi:pre-rRNA-processing protein TSR1
MLRSILSQGTPTIIPMVANLMAHNNSKTRAEVKKSLLSYIQQYIPTVERVFAADDRAEASTVLRIVCNGAPSGIRWREQRNYILPEGWRWDDEESKIVFWGTVRGKPLHVDRLLNLGSWGDFQIEKVQIT